MLVQLHELRYLLVCLYARKVYASPSSVMFLSIALPAGIPKLWSMASEKRLMSFRTKFLDTREPFTKTTMLPLGTASNEEGYFAVHSTVRVCPWKRTLKNSDSSDTYALIQINSCSVTLQSFCQFARRVQIIDLFNECSANTIQMIDDKTAVALCNFAFALQQCSVKSLSSIFLSQEAIKSISTISP